MTEQSTIKRNEWTFNYTTKQLEQATLQKVEFHSNKVNWWKSKQQETMQKVRDSGIEIKESLAEGYSNRAFRPQIQVEASLDRDLVETHTKINEHQDKLREYQGWLQVFQANPDQTLPLSHNDYLYFFGK